MEISTGTDFIEAYSEFYLQYVGVRLYSHQRFIAEAKRIGAQRTIIFDILNKLHFGDKILLAEHRNIPQTNADGTPAKPKELAQVFAYMRINGLTHNLPEEISKKVMERLTIEEVITATPVHEQRACGAYMIAYAAAVTEDIPEICRVIKEVCAEMNFPLQKNGVKFFVRGEVTGLVEPIIIEGLPSTRGYLKVKLPAQSIEDTLQGGKRTVFQIENYSRRTYMKKEVSEAYDKALLDEHKAESSQ